MAISLERSLACYRQAAYRLSCSKFCGCLPPNAFKFINSRFRNLIVPRRVNLNAEPTALRHAPTSARQIPRSTCHKHLEQRLVRHIPACWPTASSDRSPSAGGGIYLGRRWTRGRTNTELIWTSSGPAGQQRTDTSSRLTVGAVTKTSCPLCCFRPSFHGVSRFTHGGIVHDG